MNRRGANGGKHSQRDAQSTMDLSGDKSIVRVFGMVRVFGLVGSTRFELVTPAV